MILSFIGALAVIHIISNENLTEKKIRGDCQRKLSKTNAPYNETICKPVRLC
jgi:hypothetical protein